jgi:tetrapyrrole methylase family protein/MazG family protein
VVVGLGPGDPGLLTVATRDAIDSIATRFVRTARHPSAHAVGDAVAFDEVYEQASALEDVYAGIAARVADAAIAAGEVLYAVPGSPLVAERTVELLRDDRRITLEVLPALSFLDLAWARLGIDPVAAGARLVDGHRFAIEAAGSTGPMLVAQCDRALVLSDIKLSVDADPGPVIVLQRLGLPDEAVVEVAWADLDRAFVADHLTCIWIPRLAEPVAAETVRLVELVRTLRERCPWDRRQTHQSLGRHLLEESYEVLDAIDELPVAASAASVAALAAAGGAGVGVGAVVGEDEAWEHLEEELGDLLFQVAFHATLGTEAGRFGFADVARGVHDKLVARHPHVFGGAVLAGADVTDAGGWELRKKIEKDRASVMDGIPATLPSVLYADKVQRKATALGLDWPDVAPVWAVVAGELDELRAAVAVATGVEGDSVEGDSAVAAELGDVLFSVVNLGRKLGVDTEGALRAATARFRARARAVEARAAEAGIDPAGAPPAVLDRLWAQAKRQSD